MSDVGRSREYIQTVPAELAAKCNGLGIDIGWLAITSAISTLSGWSGDQVIVICRPNRLTNGKLFNELIMSLLV